MVYYTAKHETPINVWCHNVNYLIFAASAQIIPLAGFPSVDYAARTVVSHLLDYGSIRFEMGYACAIATVLFLAMIIMQKVVQRLLSKVGE